MWVVQLGVEQIQDGGRQPSCTIKKRPYLRNSLTDWHKIWQDDAQWPSQLDYQLKFQI